MWSSPAWLRRRCSLPSVSGTKTSHKRPTKKCAICSSAPQTRSRPRQSGAGAKRRRSMISNVTSGCLRRGEGYRQAGLSEFASDARSADYINRLGQTLAAQAPGEQYPYTFKIVNPSDINAFALPGGPIYINRGTIEAAGNEAELAGVISHEIAHVALRHGT